MDIGDDKMQEQKKVTMADIAKRLGVSKGLVSMALSGSDEVKDETRAEIVLAALDMGYDINKRKIAKNKKDIISIVCTDLSYFNTFFWTEVLKGVENYLSSHNYGIDLVVYKEGQDAFLLDAIDKKTKGLIVVASCDNAQYKFLSKANIPMVLVDVNNFCGLGSDSVRASNYYSAYRAAQYFVQKGHDSVAFVGAAGQALSFKARRDGFLAGIEACGGENVEYTEVIEPPVGLKYTTFNEKKTRRMLMRPNRPTAIMCANDITAIGVFDIMEKLGLKCPDDVSLIGFDNIRYDHPLIRSLTTIDVQKQKMGEEAARALIKRVNNPSSPCLSIEVVADLIERNSVKNLK